ncbi:hypothetical protein ZWY2020_019509 [Hordeum vulgare]|nr:hypothetical protein ZWY2020_019509 [Hordeum vulgare]
MVPEPWFIVGLDEPPPSWDPVKTSKFDMYAKGSPKFNLAQAAALLRKKGLLGVKMDSPKVNKKSSPKVVKQRAQWSLGLEKGLVEILMEHDTPYHRGQNGWSKETWNLMVTKFHAKHKHVKFSKSQIQDKEKELKREYRMLKEARKQSGVGWDDKRCMIEADTNLWHNLMISYPSIGKFKKKSFPLFDSLGELYDGHTAEGT